VHFTLPQCLYKGALYLTSVPVQGCTLPYLSACARVHFTLPQCLYNGALYLTSVPVQGCTFPLPQCLYKGALYLTFTLTLGQGCYLLYFICFHILYTVSMLGMKISSHSKVYAVALRSRYKNGMVGAGHGRGMDMARSRHGKGESNKSALCKSNGKNTV